MRVVCPYVTISPATRAALDASGYEWEACDVSGSDSAYWELLAGLWAAREDVAIVEHDVIPSPEALASLEACPADWCSAHVPYLGSVYAGLSCARFRAPLMARHPDLWDVVATWSNDRHGPRHWCTLDGFSRAILMQRGERQCVDHPQAGHPDPRPAHGCVPGYPPRT